jgi:hypothetical protein
MKNRNVDIVCPYIGIEYFRRITQLANTWRLVTDVEEWLLSQNKKVRENIKNFIINNLQFIHHHKDIHAKVIVANDKVFISSSNLTDKGILRRVEMGVLIEEEQVKELQKWFSDLWAQSKQVNAKDLEKYISSIRSLPPYDEINKSKIHIPSSSVSISAKLVNIDSNIQNIIKDNQLSHKRLVNSIRRRAINREWINDYFELTKEIIEFAKLESSDPRLVMSIRQDKNIPITLGQRYILAPPYKWSSMPKNESDFTIGMIMPLEYEPDYEKDRIKHSDYFYRNKQKEARWIVFDRREKNQVR